MKPWSVLSLIVYLLTLQTVALAFDHELTGHVRGHGSFTWYPENHLLSQIDGHQTFFDSSIDFRLNSNIFLSDHISLDLAYEAAAAGGQSRNALSKLPPDNRLAQFFQATEPSDDQQLFSLTHVFSNSDEYIAYHRIDRLALAVDSDYGTVKAGRQALTWGNGQIFNPLDLINPFAPADIIRDYKVGTDMLLYQVGGDLITDFQLVYVPRRDPETDEVTGSLATFGTQLRISYAELDFDLLAVKNYEDQVVGFGLTGYLGDAVFRSDFSLTFLDDDPDSRQYLSAIANLDYSWTWQDKNWYGFIELYYNGLGTDNSIDALQDEALTSRLLRGELFVTGSWYLDTMLHYEAHPLINCFTSIIINLKDGSFLLQPRVAWDLTESAQILTGIDLPIGGAGDEFGELESPKKDISSGRGIQAYFVATWFF